MEKKIVSPFEYVIMQAANIPDLSDHRPETSEEKELRLRTKAIDFAKSIKVKTPNS
jgi:hypothetical protein